MKTIIQFFIVLLFISGCSESIVDPGPVERGEITDVSEIITLTPELLNFYLSDIELPPSIELSHTITALSIEYTTVDAAGNLIKASGALIYPHSSSSPLLSIQHGTVTKRDAVASVNPISSTEGIIGIISAANGYVTCVPDYPGFGASDVIHPYIHAKSLALSVIDFLRAAKSYCMENDIALNDQLFIGGYSEGGYATMATQREIEQNYASEFTITASAPMSGPYDLMGMTKIILEQSSYRAPAYIAFLLTAYNEIYQWDRLDEIFQAPYASMMLDLFDGSNSYSQINNQLPEEILQLLKQDFINGVLNDTDSQVISALQENTLLDWTPQAPIRLFHGDSDETVPYENSTTALQVFQNRGADIELITIPGGTHFSAGEAAAFGMVEWLNTFRN